MWCSGSKWPFWDVLNSGLRLHLSRFQYRIYSTLCMDMHCCLEHPWWIQRSHLSWKVWMMQDHVISSFVWWCCTYKHYLPAFLAMFGKSNSSTKLFYICLTRGNITCQVKSGPISQIKSNFKKKQQWLIYNGKVAIHYNLYTVNLWIKVHILKSIIHHTFDWINT